MIAGPDGKTSVSSNALHHIANELILKSIIKDFLRTKFDLSPWFIDHLFVELPNTANRFGSYRVGVEAQPWKSVRRKVWLAERFVQRIAKRFVDIPPLRWKRLKPTLIQMPGSFGMLVPVPGFVPRQDHDRWHRPLAAALNCRHSGNEQQS